MLLKKSSSGMHGKRNVVLGMFMFLISLSAAYALFTTYITITGSAEIDTNPDIVMWLPFDEGSGATANDISQYNNDGTLMPTGSEPAWKSGADCKFENCLQFDGVNDYVEVGDANSLDLTDFTIDVWVNVSQNKNHNGIVIKGFDSYENYELLGMSDGAIYFTIKWSEGGRSYPKFPADSLVVDEWVHIAATYNGTHMKGYKNGVEVLSESISKTPQTNNRPVLIGAEEKGAGLMPARFFSGSIDNLRIWNIALTHGQIQSIYQRGI